MSDMDNLQRQVSEWAMDVFPHSNRRTIFEHMKDEMAELEMSVSSRNDAEEAADVFLILLHFAERMGFSLYDEAAKKFEINKARKWGEPDGRGVVRHVDVD